MNARVRMHSAAIVLLMVLVGIVGLSGCVLAQDGGASLAQVLAGKSHPLTLKAADVGPEYFAVTLGVSGGSGLDSLYSNPVMLYAMRSSSSGGDERETQAILERMMAVWTKGETVTVDGSRYYVVYGFSMSSMSTSASRPSLPDKLTLRLIKTDSVNSITPLGDLKPVLSPGELTGRTNSTEEDEDNVEPGDDKARSMNNLKQLGLAMMMYASDWDEYTPYVQKTETVLVVLPPYIKNPEVLKSPRPDGGYLFNINAGGVKLEDFKAPATTLLFWEPKPWPDGTRLVCYADGHVDAVTEADWPGVEAALKMKLPRRKGMKPLPLDYKGQPWGGG